MLKAVFNKNILSLYRNVKRIFYKNIFHSFRMKNAPERAHITFNIVSIPYFFIIFAVDNPF
jgi:hypothetical protein